jgi:hypothetical protein
MKTIVMCAATVLLTASLTAPAYALAGLNGTGLNGMSVNGTSPLSSDNQPIDLNSLQVDSIILAY